MKIFDTWQNTTSKIPQMKSEGVTTVGRYYSKSTWKALTKAEAQALSKAGIGLFVVYQDSNNSYASFSKERGRQAARNAIEIATEIGQPASSAIYFAVDYDASPSEVKGEIKEYFKALNKELKANAVEYFPGVYGNGEACGRLLEWDLVKYTWLSMSGGHHGHKEFLKSGKWSLLQHLEATFLDMDVDPDEANGTADFGAFHVAASGVIAPEALRASGGYVYSAKTGPMVVKTQGLNFRTEPDGAIIRELNMCDQVEVLDNWSADGAWKRVKVDGHEGAVFSRYLREAEPERIERLLGRAVTEWLRFDKGRADEKQDPYAGYVGEMWKNLGEDYDGRSVYPGGQDVPWSAAFISFVISRSGKAYSNFKMSGQHSVFTHDAIQSRLIGRTDRPFWGYRITEVKPALGDIVVRNRSGNNFSFDYAEVNSDYISHSDFVTEMLDNSIRVLGGNVGNTVTMSNPSGTGDTQEYELDSDGYIKPGQKVIAILKNRSRLV